MSITILGVRTIGVPVTDQDRAVDFYVGTLGMTKVRDLPMPQLGGRWIEVAPPGSPEATTVALVPAKDSAGTSVEASVGASAGVSVGVETGIRLAVKDAAEVHADLTAGGVDVGELLRWDGVPPMFVVRDPDGNRLEIVE